METYKKQYNIYIYIYSINMAKKKYFTDQERK